LLTATRKIEAIHTTETIYIVWTKVSRFYKRFRRNVLNVSRMLLYYHSGIQKYGGNPGNLTRLNGFRVHSIYMIRFPPRQNRLNKAFCFLYGGLN